MSSQDVFSWIATEPVLTLFLLSVPPFFSTALPPLPASMPASPVIFSMHAHSFFSHSLAAFCQFYEQMWPACVHDMFMSIKPQIMQEVSAFAVCMCMCVCM